VLNVRIHISFIILLFLSSSYMVLVSFPVRAQTDYSIDVIGYTWNHSTLSVNILPQENETWWNPSYLNASLHGIAQWNDAIQEFASTHTDFSYLSNVHLIPTVSYEVVSGFDIYVRWRAKCESEATIGESQAIIKSSCITVNNTIYLAAKSPSGHVMTEVDMQNIVVHEIGHTFGLSHTPHSSDVMYATVDFLETVKPVSSLDIYAISYTFNWMKNSLQLSSPVICPEQSVLTLPLTLDYVHFPISTENLPVYSSTNLFEYVLRLLLRLESLLLIIVIVTLFVVTVIMIKRRKIPN